ncbi:MAG: diguanylate cyclase [Sulfurimonas sp.]|nr:diguanylate cyclase [Sulfurimonas sp.]
MSRKQILILENNQKNFETLDAIFTQEDFECSAVLDKETLDALDIELFDLILVNSHVKYIDMKDLALIVHADFVIKVPIVYLDNAKEHNKKHLQECFDSGVCEYLKKPFDKHEILSRVHYHFNQFQKMKEYKLRVDKLAQLATIDQLSKSSSKMHMNAILKHQLNNYKRYKVNTSIIYMSLVNVDKIVGLFGFEKGERLISLFAKELKKVLRESDALARWAGADFIMDSLQTLV